MSDKQAGIGTEIAKLGHPPVVSADQWDAALKKMLVREKELTRARDALAAERRRMPWLAVDKHMNSRDRAETSRCSTFSMDAVN